MHRQLPLRLKAAASCIVLLMAAVLMPSHHLFGQSPRSSSEADLGASVYASRCVQCHGADGKGDGPASGFLVPRPRDFTSGTYKIRSTESGSIPTDEDLLASIRHGMPGSSMPDWEPFLGGDSLTAVLAYVKSFSPRFAKERPRRVRMAAMPRATAGSIAAGKRVYAKLQCASCHGTDGMGTGAVATDLMDDLGNEISAANLTEPWTFRGGLTARDVYLRLRTGMDGTPMPSFKSAASESELMNLANYVVSLGRKPVWSMNAEEVSAFYKKQDEEAKQNPLVRGKYLVKGFGCSYCHSPVHDDGTIMEDLRYAGGQKVDLYPFGTYVSYNLTSDKETGLGGWTDQQIKTLLTSGVRRDGSRMLPFPMPWAAYAGLKDEDLNAMIAYLRTIPPVYNKIPPPKSEGFFSYLWGKFQLLILKKDIPGFTYPGNAGTPKQGSMSSNDVADQGGRP